MALARCRHDWGQTAQLLCLLANAHRDPKQRRRPFNPDDFNPYPRPRQRPPAPRRSIDAGQLADWVFGKTPDAEDDGPDEPVVVTPPPPPPADDQPSRANGYNGTDGWSAI
jgi:hypothetical protein